MVKFKCILDFFLKLWKICDILTSISIAWRSTLIVVLLANVTRFNTLFDDNGFKYE